MMNPRNRPPMKRALPAVMRWMSYLLVTTVLAGCQGTGCLFAPPAEDSVSQHYRNPVVVISGFRPCQAGVAYVKPLFIHARGRRGDIVAETVFSGVTGGQRPVTVPLYLPESASGVVTIEVGQCPDFMKRPEAAMRCVPVSWKRIFKVRIPTDHTGWRATHDISLRSSKCRDRE